MQGWQCGLVFLLLLQDVVCLRLHDPEATETEAAKAPKKYAYVTMVVNSHLISQEEYKKISYPMLPSWKVSPCTGMPGCEHPYEDITLGHADLAVGKKHLGRVDLDKPTSQHAGQHYGVAEKIAGQLLRSGSKYPVIVLTNDKDKAAEVPKHPNMIPIVIDKWAERTCAAAYGYEVTLQKILCWQLDDYEKVMWLDADVDVMTNPDFAFDILPVGAVMGMRNDAFCDYTPDYEQPEYVKNRRINDMSAEEHHEFFYRNSTNHDFASSVMLLEPNKKDLDGLLALSKELKYCGTDQDLVAEYFWRKSRTADHELMQFFPGHVALWGRCARAELQKSAYTPAIIHKTLAKTFPMGGAVKGVVKDSETSSPAVNSEDLTTDAQQVQIGKTS